MKGWAVLGIALLSAFAISCNDIGDTGGGGGGGPGGGFTFQSGYVFVRPDDQKVYIVDDANLSALQVLSNGDDRQPALSTDGKSVVFVHGTNAGAPELDVVASGATTPPTTVLPASSDRLNLRNPVFSPDGATIAFVYDDQGGVSHVGVVGVSGEGFTPVSTGSGDYVSPSFASSSTLLVGFGSSASDVHEIDSIDLASGAQTPVLASLGNTAITLVDRVVVSPDGTRAAFEAQVSSGVTRIFVADLSSGEVVQLTDHPGEPGAADSYPTWAGITQIAFSSNAGNADNVYVAAATDSMTTGILTLPSATQPWYGP